MDLVAFTEEIFSGKLHFLCSGSAVNRYFRNIIKHIKSFKMSDVFIYSLFLEFMERSRSPLFFTAQEKEGRNTVLVALNEKD